VHIAGFNASRVSGRALTARAMDAHNSFDRPDIVKPVLFTSATLEHGDVKLNLPAQAVVVLELR
jgi:alpha-N-arabinofuranosidase